MIPTSTSRRGHRYFDIEVNPIPVQAILNGVMSSMQPVALRTWMVKTVQPWFADQIVTLFAYEGRGIDGWAPLTAATLRRRSAEDGTAINYVSGALMEYLISNYDIKMGALGSELVIPGDIDDSLMLTKLRIAQHGSEINDTPARPVLVVEQSDRQAIIRLLQHHVMSHANPGMMLANIGSL